jgi:hypothetical protein
MALDVWFRVDVERILLALARAASRYNGEFQRGYIDALGDVAQAFGLVSERGDAYGQPLASGDVLGEERRDYDR